MNSKVSLLKNSFNFRPSFMAIRSMKKFPGGIKYTGFTYYPRTENFQDPPYEPSKLFLVIRHKPVKGTNPKERQALKLLNLDGNQNNGNVAIVKNIPNVNALLWKVKHLVEIKPITWKGELPKDGDYSGTYLKDTGELLISPKLKLTSDKIKATEKYIEGETKLDGKYFKKYLKKKWLNPYFGDV